MASLAHGARPQDMEPPERALRPATEVRPAGAPPQITALQRAQPAVGLASGAAAGP